MPTKEDLMEKIRSLQQHRLSKELSDDFAYSNGSLRRIDEQIAETRMKLADAFLVPSCRTQQLNDGAHDVE